MNVVGILVGVVGTVVGVLVIIKGVGGEQEEEGLEEWEGGCMVSLGVVWVVCGVLSCLAVILCGCERKWGWKLGVGWGEGPEGAKDEEGVEGGEGKGEEEDGFEDLEF